MALVDLGRIAGPRFRLYCFPLLMTDTNTAPCRVVAEIES
jgi:hypothetical protein